MQIKATEAEKVTPDSTLQVGKPARRCAGGEGLAAGPSFLWEERAATG